ncbi:MAG: malonate--CoA ligase [Marinosulfonomonas sp.]
MYDANFLAHALQSGSSKRREAPFLTASAPAIEMSYAAFFARAEQVAAALVSQGLCPGDRVAVQAAKTVGMLELYVGTVLAGGVFLPLNTAYTRAEIRYFLNDAKPKIFVCDGARLDELTPVAKDTGVPHLWTLNADESGTFADHREAATTGFKAVARGKSDLAAILYTSGTTGRSKGAMLTHGALAANASVLVQSWAFSSDDVLLHALPIFHTHGLFVATNTILMSGGSMVFMRGFDVDAILHAMPRASVLMGVPTFYVRLLKAENLGEASKDMRLFISGSAPLLAETHDQWNQKTGHAILERYGMTETNMNTSNPNAGERRAGTVGMPLPGVEIRICEPGTETELEPGEVGILEVRGPNVFAGYWQMPEKTAEELRPDGFFITGDLARIDQAGYVQIVGREKDLIISGGFNVYPKEIEVLVDDIPGVLESAVIGVPHPDFGEAVVAAVVLDGTKPVDEAGIMDTIGGQIARYKQPKSIVFVQDLPRNTMGKVQKNVLRQDWGSLFAA